jgi:hypothetical protein
MKIFGISRYLQTILAVGLPIFCSYPDAASALPAPATLVESKLNGDTILGAPVQKLVHSVRDCVSDNPARPGGIVKAVLGSGRADADALAPLVTVAAIEGLGNDPSAMGVSDIVYSAVSITPAVVLETVRAAVRVAPARAKEIVRAAIKAIPNPGDKIQPINDKVNQDRTDLSKDDPKDMSESSNDNNLEPIAEAIARAAALGDPSVSYHDMMAEINLGPRPNKFSLNSTYQGYYYPPLVSGGPGPSGTPGVPSEPSGSPPVQGGGPPTAMPSPPVVSP